LSQPEHGALMTWVIIVLIFGLLFMPKELADRLPNTRATRIGYLLVLLALALTGLALLDKKDQAIQKTTTNSRH